MADNLREEISLVSEANLQIYIYVNKNKTFPLRNY